MKLNLRHSTPLEMCLCVFAQISFWPNTMDKGKSIMSGVLTEIEVIFAVLLLQSEGNMKLKFCHSVPLEICIIMTSFFAEVKIFNFWPKTMDYSQAF